MPHLMRTRRLSKVVLAVALMLACGGALAEAPPAVAPGTPRSTPLQPVAIYGADGNIVSAFGGGPTSAAGSTSGFTASTISTQALAAATRRFLAIVNQSGTATLACAFGAAATASVGGAGSFDIPPGNTRTWAGSFVPSDALWCVASAAATPVTIQSN